MGRGVEGAPWHCAYASGGDFSDRLRPRLAWRRPVAHCSWEVVNFGPAICRHARSCLGAHFDPIELGVFEAKLTRLDGKVAAEAGLGPPSVAALRFPANPLGFVSALYRPLAKEAAI